MKFGYENEYFVLNENGKILEQIPYDLPHDAHGVLAEVRSVPADTPTDAYRSFTEVHYSLSQRLAASGWKLHNIQGHTLQTGRHETAGFHIHFSDGDRWTKWAANQYMWAQGPLTTPPADIAAIIAKLDKRFEDLYRGVPRHPHYWRPKPHGWEYRRLPATVDLDRVTQVLAEEFPK